MKRPAYAAMLAGWAIALVGYWLPWLAPRPAALRFNGFELAEWSTRLPGAQDWISGAGRLHFMGTLAGLAVLGGVLAGLGAEVPGALRRSLGAISAGHTALLLPGYPLILGVLQDPEASAQVTLGLAAAIALALAYWRTPLLSRHIRWGMAAVLALATAILAHWSLAAVRTLFAEILPEMGRTGSGFYLLLAGCLTVFLAGLAGAVTTWQD